MRRHGAKAQHGAAAIPMLVVTVVVGVTCYRRGPVMGVDRHFGIAVTVLMPIMAMLVVVAVLMLLRVIMGRMGLVGALSHYFGQIGRKRDGQGRGQRPEQICDSDKPSHPSARQLFKATHPITVLRVSLNRPKLPTNQSPSSQLSTPLSLGEQPSCNDGVCPTVRGCFRSVGQGRLVILFPAYFQPFRTLHPRSGRTTQPGILSNSRGVSFTPHTPRRIPFRTSRCADQIAHAPMIVAGFRVAERTSSNLT